MHSRTPDPNVLLVAGIIASLAIALVAWLGRLGGAETLTLFLLGTVISLLLELFVRFGRFVSESAELSTVGEAIHASPRLRDFVIATVAGYSKIARHNNGLFKRYATATMDQSQRTFNELAQGRYHAPQRIGDEGRDAIEVARAAKRSIEATCYGNIAKWWDSPGGRQYLDVNKEVIAGKRVKISRVFILQPADNHDDVARIAMEQRSIGIDVQIVSEDEIVEVLRKDYVIADKRVVSAGAVNADGLTITPLMIINPDELAIYVDKFTRVQRRARPLETWLSLREETNGGALASRG